jgi:hypothetical protein
MPSSWKKIVTSGSSAEFTSITVDSISENSSEANSNNVLLYNTTNGTFSYTSSYGGSSLGNANTASLALSGGLSDEPFYVNNDAFVSGNLTVSGAFAAASAITIADTTLEANTSTGIFIFGSGGYDNGIQHEMTGNLYLSSSVGITVNMPDNVVGFHGTASWASQSVSASFASASDSASYALTASYALNDNTSGQFENLTVTDDLTVADDATISGQLTVAESAVFSSGVTIAGNLIVNGTQTILNTQDLFIEDRFIYIGGKQSKFFDCGIVFNNNKTELDKDDGLGQYEAIFWDQSVQRFKVASEVDPDQNDFTGPVPEKKISGSIVTVREGEQSKVEITSDNTETNFVQNPNTEDIRPVYGVGEMFITQKGDIFIYAPYVE